MADDLIFAPRLTVKAVADLYGYDNSVVYRWIKEKEPGKKLVAMKMPGGDYRIRPEDLADFERRCLDQNSPDQNTGSSPEGGSGPSPGPTPTLGEPGPFRRGQQTAAKPKFGLISG